MAITAEAMTVGVKAGLGPRRAAGGYQRRQRAQHRHGAKFPQQVVNRRFESGFRLELMLKDVRLALAEAQAQGVPMQLGGRGRAALGAGRRRAPAEGADHTEVVRLFEQLAGVTVELG